MTSDSFGVLVSGFPRSSARLLGVLGRSRWYWGWVSLRRVMGMEIASKNWGSKYRDSLIEGFTTS